MLDAPPRQKSLFLLVVLWTCVGSVGCCQLKSVTTERLPDGRVGQSYAASLEANCKGGDVLWSRTAGSLPPGISLAQDGRLSGTPTLAGTFTLTVLAEERRPESPPKFISTGFSITVAP
jgi:hypothetical protein